MNLDLNEESSLESIEPLKLDISWQIYHRIVFKLLSSEMENGKKQKPLYNDFGDCFHLEQHRFMAVLI